MHARRSARSPASPAPASASSTASGSAPVRPRWPRTNVGVEGDAFRRLPVDRSFETIAAMRVLHFSDVHVGVPLSALPLRDMLGKRLLGAANLVLRRQRLFRDAREKLGALAR